MVTRSGDPVPRAGADTPEHENRSALVTPWDVSAVLVTRGDVDFTPILDSFTSAGVFEFVVWDNSRRDNLAVYGRYAAVAECERDIVYVQDDDCLIDVARVISAYEPGRLVANMPRSRWDDYPDSALVGWGAVFDRSLLWKPPELRYDQDTFRRVCDVYFSAMVPRTIIDIGFKHLPWAETADRMFKQRGHKAERDAMLEVCRRLRPSDDDVRVAA